MPLSPQDAEELDTMDMFNEMLAELDVSDLLMSLDLAKDRAKERSRQPQPATNSKTFSGTRRLSPSRRRQRAHAAPRPIQQP